MKKLRNLCMWMMTLSFLTLTACGDDNDDKESTSRNVSFEYYVSLSPDILTLADVRAEYYDENGKMQTETITSNSWSKSLRCSNPERFGYAVTMTAKSNIKELLTKDSYKLAISYKIDYSSSDGLADSNSSGYNTEIEKSDVAEYIQKHANIVSIHYAVSDSGESFQLYN